jgi:hypothetical protein
MSKTVIGICAGPISDFNPPGGGEVKMSRIRHASHILARLNGQLPTPRIVTGLALNEAETALEGVGRRDHVMEAHQAHFP